MSRLPTIITPYPGPSLNKDVQDIIIYLRPETNGIIVESTLLKAIHNSPEYNKLLEIVYLANIPGDFIIQNHIIEEHYSFKIHFATQGKKAFTETMKKEFESFFNISFEKADIIGSFEALNRLNLSYDQLFNLWVPESNLTSIHNQIIKRHDNLFIVNYDIPALLHKNSQKTDVFVIILRSFLPYKEIHNLIISISGELKKKNIISSRKPMSYVFHYSKSPFEQILDGIGYIYTNTNTNTNNEEYASEKQNSEKYNNKSNNKNNSKNNIALVALEELSFFAYLLSKGCSKSEIINLIKNPIMMFQTNKGKKELNLFDYTFENSFTEAYDKFKSKIDDCNHLL